MIKSKGYDIDYNMCYSEKATLAIVAEQLNSLAKNPTSIVVKKPGYAYTYTGSSTRLDSLGLEFVGLEGGIKEVVESEQNV